MLKMQRPKSFKDLVLGILIVAVLGVGAYFIADALKAELVPGDIVVRSGNEGDYRAAERDRRAKEERFKSVRRAF